MKTARLDRPVEPAPVTAGVTTMKAIVQDAYGSSAEDVLRLAGADIPKVADDEVLVRVVAASVDRGTWHIMSGLPYPIRAAGFGMRTPKSPNPGRCLAGTVESVGREVSGLTPGTEVYGTGVGSFAEYAKAKANKLAPKPANLSFEQAATVPVSAVTALQAVRKAEVQAGQKVLVIGASGGVGSFALQIARAFGAEVTGVCSTSKTDLVRDLGADHVIDYTRGDFLDGRQHYDVILDTGGNSRLSDLRRALTATGTLVIVGGETAGKWFDSLTRTLKASLLRPLVKQKLVGLLASENSTDLTALTELIESGRVTPAIDRSYPLSEVPAAVCYVQEGRARGKVAIRV